MSTPRPWKDAPPKHPVGRRLARQLADHPEPRPTSAAKARVWARLDAAPARRGANLWWRAAAGVGVCLAALFAWLAPGAPQPAERELGAGVVHAAAPQGGIDIYRTGAERPGALRIETIARFALAPSTSIEVDMGMGSVTVQRGAARAYTDGGTQLLLTGARVRLEPGTEAVVCADGDTVAVVAGHAALAGSAKRIGAGHGYPGDDDAARCTAPSLRGDGLDLVEAVAGEVARPPSAREPGHDGGWPGSGAHEPPVAADRPSAASSRDPAAAARARRAAVDGAPEANDARRGGRGQLAPAPDEASPGGARGAAAGDGVTEPPGPPDREHDPRADRAQARAPEDAPPPPAAKTAPDEPRTADVPGSRPLAAPDEDEAARLYRLGRAEADPDAAVRLFDRVVALGGPYTELAGHQAVRRRLAQGQTQDALRRIDAVAARHPQGNLQPELWLMRIDALVRAGRTADARPDLERYLETVGRSARHAELRLLLADLHRQRGDCAAALPVYAAVARAPHAEAALYFTAVCQRALGRTTEAQATFTDYLARYPEGRFADAARRAVDKD